MADSSMIIHSILTHSQGSLCRARRSDRAKMAGAEGTGDESSGLRQKPAMDHFVSHTALLVCAHRVHESRRRDALFKDPVAEVMVPEVRVRLLVCLFNPIPSVLRGPPTQRGRGDQS